MMMSGILAQEGAQRRREGQAGLVVDVDLVDAGQVDFGRVFRRRDVHAGLVQQVQAGVERHRLARTRRAGDQHHAVRAADGVQQRSFSSGRSRGHRCPGGAARIQDTDHDLLAEQRGQVLTRKSMTRSGRS
jgi:hypothetical protein